MTLKTDMYAVTAIKYYYYRNY